VLKFELASWSEQFQPEGGYFCNINIRSGGMASSRQQGHDKIGAMLEASVTMLFAALGKYVCPL
jgi:hypothetical protein